MGELEDRVARQLKELRDDLRARCPLVNVGPHYAVPVYDNATSALTLGVAPLRRAEGRALFAAWGDDYLTMLPLVLFEADPRFGGFWSVESEPPYRWGEQVWLNKRPDAGWLWLSVRGRRLRVVQHIATKHYPLLETLQ